MPPAVRSTPTITIATAIPATEPMTKDCKMLSNTPNSNNLYNLLLYKSKLPENMSKTEKKITCGDLFGGWLVHVVLLRISNIPGTIRKILSYTSSYHEI